jgi:hypothetical protein
MALEGRGRPHFAGTSLRRDMSERSIMRSRLSSFELRRRHNRCAGQLDRFWAERPNRAASRCVGIKFYLCGGRPADFSGYGIAAAPPRWTDWPSDLRSFAEARSSPARCRRGFTSPESSHSRREKGLRRAVAISAREHGRGVRRFGRS